MEQQRSTLAIHSHQFCIAEVEMFEKSPDFEMRKLRNIFLRASDWTQMADSPLTVEKKAEWATYRQALRDLPAQPGFPHEIVWQRRPDQVDDIVQP